MKPSSHQIQPNARLVVCKVLLEVLTQGQSLKQTLTKHTESLSAQSAAQAQAISYGVLREYGLLQSLLGKLIDKPLRNKDLDIELLILIGLYEIYFTQAAQHAIVSEVVNAVKKCKKLWATKLVNAVLRNAIRTHQSPDSEADNLPYQWLIDTLKQHYPDNWQAIWHDSNQAPPMHIRVNQQKIKRDAYTKLLHEAGIECYSPHPNPLPQGERGAPLSINENVNITLQNPCPVSQLPHFAEGHCSVQDIAAQQAAFLLDPQPGEYILDACAAPGGKTAHLLETCPEINLLALDCDPKRIEHIHENLKRLSLNAQIKTGDAGQSDWFDGKLFDKILLDAPCSGTGVIRRHPDIKFLRKASDIEQLTRTQSQLLNNLWDKLKPGGVLLYATCSILPDENQHQIQDFLKQHSDAQLQFEQHILPETNGPDGFYYAKIERS